jgi:hypothetical protein
MFTGPSVPGCQIKPGVTYLDSAYVERALENFPSLKRFVIPLETFVRMKRRTIMRPLGLNRLSLKARE